VWAADADSDGHRPHFSAGPGSLRRLPPQHTSGVLGLPFALTDQRAVPVFVVLAAVSAAPWTFGPMVSGGRRLKSSRRRCIVGDRLSVSDLGLEERLAWAGWQGRTNGIKQR